MQAFLMTWADFNLLFLTPQAAWLPGATLAQLGLWISWALVLGAAVFWLTGPLPARWRWLIAGVLVAWTLLSAALLPTYSPAHWLGLAFQSPSLTSVLLCQVYLGMRWWQRNGPTTRQPTQVDSAWLVLAGAGVLLGWALLVDMLTWWPVSLYAWGFSPLAVALVCALTVGLWLAWGSCASGTAMSAALACVVSVFVVTRLPSGNLWDALLDPWLWVALHVWLALRLRHWWFVAPR
jgi:hypothetical protein